MNSQEARQLRRAKGENCWSGDPEMSEGGGVREFLYAEPLGVNAFAPPEWPMGENSGEP